MFTGAPILDFRAAEPVMTPAALNALMKRRGSGDIPRQFRYPSSERDGAAQGLAETYARHLVVLLHTSPRSTWNAVLEEAFADLPAKFWDDYGGYLLTAAAQEPGGTDVYTALLQLPVFSPKSLLTVVQTGHSPAALHVALTSDPYKRLVNAARLHPRAMAAALVRRPDYIAADREVLDVLVQWALAASSSPEDLLAGAVGPYPDFPDVFGNLKAFRAALDRALTTRDRMEFISTIQHARGLGVTPGLDPAQEALAATVGHDPRMLRPEGLPSEYAGIVARYLGTPQRK